MPADFLPTNAGLGTPAALPGGERAATAASPDSPSIRNEGGRHEDACTTAEFCFPQTQVEPGTPESYLFAGSVHSTTHANRLIADHVRQAIDHLLTGWRS